MCTCTRRMRFDMFEAWRTKEFFPLSRKISCRVGAGIYLRYPFCLITRGLLSATREERSKAWMITKRHISGEKLYYHIIPRDCESFSFTNILDGVLSRRAVRGSTKSSRPGSTKCGTSVGGERRYDSGGGVNTVQLAWCIFVGCFWGIRSQLRCPN